MERKRKLPARAAARAEQPTKKRNITPLEHSATPAPAESTPEPVPPPPEPLPTSVQPGKPLPTVEKSQSQDLSDDEYQSVGESGVLTESLSRSRAKWVNEGLFEKYWTKPHKRKGVVVEDPKNPPKDSMTRIGNVTITIEPHIIDAVMFTVKKPPQQQATQQQQTRPILQYGPANNAYAAPTASSSPTKAESPAPPPGAAAAPVGASAETRRQLSPAAATSMSPAPPQRQTPLMAPPPPPLPSGMTPPPAARPPMGSQPSGLAHPAAAPAAAPPSQTPARNPTTASPLQHPAHSPAVPAPGAASSPRPGGTTPQPGQPATSKASTKPSPDDPVIALLAERASKDETLRNLMKRVAMGKAGDTELVHFQRIIDQLNVECKAKQAANQAPVRPPGPPAERLTVEGRTVKYFADEVRAILGIVLTTNPNQKAADLKPPPRSDPLVVLVVKTALENVRTKDMINRIADGRPGPNDGQDLKEIIERLNKDMNVSPANGAQSSAPPATPSHGGPIRLQQNLQTPVTPGGQQNPQALRSKGPPPAPKPDIADVVFDFGSGDRYLFPKYSIVEYVPVPAGQQLLVSFLLVRKGSFSEYGGDPKLDYYQPVTIRLSVPSGKSLDNINRVVAPQEEVRRYMDDVMDNMTRSEFLLLAMRLPRKELVPEKDKDKDGPAADDNPHAKSSVATPKAETPKTATPEPSAAAKPGVLWAAPRESPRPVDPAHALKMRQAEEETQAQYQRLIQSVTAKATETV